MLVCLAAIPEEGSAVGLEHGARQRFGEDVRRVALGLDVLRGSVRITQEPGKITLDMEEYVERMVEDAFPGGVHHTYTTPAEPDLSKVVYAASLAKDTSHVGTPVGKRFRRLTMQALFKANQLGHDVALAVNHLSRVQAYPGLPVT